MLKLSKYFMFVFVSVCSLSVLAIGVDSVQLEISGHANQVKQLIVNDGSGANNYTVQVKRIDFPDTDAKELPSQYGELVAIPSMLRLNKGSSDYIKYQYTGADDDKERYYQVSLIESAKEKYDALSSKKLTSLNISTRLDSILVVRPRKLNVDYKFKDGKIINNGNAYFVIQVDAECGKKELITHYLAPGREYILPSLERDSSVSLFIDDDTKPLITCIH